MACAQTASSIHSRQSLPLSIASSTAFSTYAFPSRFKNTRLSFIFFPNCSWASTTPAYLGLTDDDEALSKLAEYISSYNVVQKAELLPYHTMGAYKYEAQGLDYKLKGVEPLSAERPVSYTHLIN